MAACPNNDDEEDLSKQHVNNDPPNSGERAYDRVAKYNEFQLKDLLDSIVLPYSKQGKPLTETSKTALILLEREQAQLREESGCSSDDSPDLSKHSTHTRKTKISSGLKFPKKPFLNSPNSRCPSYRGSGGSHSVDNSHEGPSGQSSAAARNTAGSLGSLHDLTEETRGNRYSRNNTKQQQSPHAASSSASTSNANADSSGASTAQNQGQHKASTRTRTGGSCGNLSRSSFDTQPPGSSRRNKRSKEVAPASSSVREGGSLQNLSKAESGPVSERKGLHKSGSLSHVFSEEGGSNKSKQSRKRKPSNETQGVQRNSEQQHTAAAASPPTSSSSDSEDQDYNNTYVRHYDEEEAVTQQGSSDEVQSVEVEDMKKCAEYTVAPDESSDKLLSHSFAQQTLGLKDTAGDHTGADMVGAELLEVVSHTAHKDNSTTPEWLGSPNAGSHEVDKSVGFFSGSKMLHPQDVSPGGNLPNRGESIESEAFTANSTSTSVSGGKSDKQKTVRSDTPQVSRPKDISGTPVLLSNTAIASKTAFSNIQKLPYTSPPAALAVNTSPPSLPTDKFQQRKDQRDRKKVKRDSDKSQEYMNRNEINVKEINSILEYIGAVDEDATATSTKKKKKQVPGKKEDKKKEEDVNKDDHKKEDSGGGKKKKEDKDEPTNKNGLIEKELKKNGIVSDNRNDVSVNNNSIDNNSKSSSVKSSNCDSNRNVKSVAEASAGSSAAIKSPNSSSGATSNTNAKKSDDRKKNKKNKGNEGIRESSSVEDLVSKCKMSEQIVSNKHKTVDDGEVNKKRNKANAKRNSDNVGASAAGPSNISTKDKKGKSYSESSDSPRDVIPKNTSGANKVQNPNLKKSSKRLSSSNSDLSNCAATRGSEFGRDFYEAGDPYLSASPSRENLIQSQKFELVTRKKKSKKQHPTQSAPTSSSNVSNTSASTPSGKARYNEEWAARDGYREKNVNSNRHKYNNKDNFGSSASSTSQMADHESYRKKSPINFDEAPRTPHDGDFMARLSATNNNNNSSERNTTTSAPNSDSSDSDGDDSVHSMPTESTTPRPELKRPPSSTDNTPQASYANIAKMPSTTNRRQGKKSGQQERSAVNPSNTTTVAQSNRSAAACSTSDQSLTTWSKGNVATIVASGTGSSNNVKGSESFLSPRPTVPGNSRHSLPPSGSAAAAVVGNNPTYHHQKTRSIPENFFNDNFPPLSSSAATYRQTSLDRDLLNAPVNTDKSIRKSALLPDESKGAGTVSANLLNENTSKMDKNSSLTGVKTTDSLSNTATQVKIKHGKPNISDGRTSVKELPLDNSKVSTSSSVNGHIITSPIASSDIAADKLDVNNANVSHKKHSDSSNDNNNIKKTANSQKVTSNNSTNKTPITSNKLNKTKEKRVKQNDPVVFVNQSIPTQPHKLSFMCPSTIDSTSVDDLINEANETAAYNLANDLTVPPAATAVPPPPPQSPKSLVVSSNTAAVNTSNDHHSASQAGASQGTDPNGNLIVNQAAGSPRVCQVKYHPPLVDVPTWRYKECVDMLLARWKDVENSLKAKSHSVTKFCPK